LLSPSQPALHQSPQQLLPSSSSRNIRAQLNPLDISLSRVPGAFLDLAPVASSILDKARAGQTYIPIDTLMPESEAPRLQRVRDWRPMSMSQSSPCPRRITWLGWRRVSV
jgi:hypothetical protein